LVSPNKIAELDFHIINVDAFAKNVGNIVLDAGARIGEN
jgi:hypothetical protein